MHEGHGGLVHAAIPVDIARSTVAVPVDVLVVLVVDWRLSSTPLAVRIWDRRVPGEDTRDRPVEEVRVVDESLGVEGVIIEDDRPVGAKTTADTPNDEPADPSVSEPAADVEILDGELADDSEAEEDMIRAQAEQVERLRGAGFLPPVHMQIPTTVVSPVPEENEDIEF